MTGMFVRHSVAMIVMVVGVVVGIILALTDDWKTGLIVGVIIVAIGMIFAVINMAYSAHSINKGIENEFGSFGRQGRTPRRRR